MKSKKTVERYGRSFQIFDQYADYQRSIAFSILQIGELSGGFPKYTEPPPQIVSSGDP